ncbi:MAG: nucleotidyltransferase domain-containing protein, partial [Stellaceae bacterium]
AFARRCMRCMAVVLSARCCSARARGDARPDSDYDVAVFLRDMNDRGAELHRLADLSTDIIDATGEFVHALPYPAGAYNERTPLMRELRREGIEL